MSEIDTSPAALLALANQWDGPRGTVSEADGMAAALRAVAAEKEAQAVPQDRAALATDIKAAVWGLTSKNFPDLMAAIDRLAAPQATDTTERDRLKALNAELLAALGMARALLVEIERYEVNGASIRVIDAAIAKAAQP